MKIQNFLLIIGLVIMFLGGFFAGKLSSSNNQGFGPTKMSELPNSAKQLKQKPIPKWKQENNKVLIGYVQDFRDPNIVDYSRLTHVIFSFAHPTKEGSLLLNEDFALKNLRSMVTKAHDNDTKVMLAVGGWYHLLGGESYQYFKSAISNQDARTKLVNELTSLTEREKLDGIDIDFEHPRSGEDADNLTVFIKELSEQLHSREKELSIAVHSKIHGGTLTEAHFINYNPVMFQYVDHVNIMAYDGQYDGGYNAANLSPFPFTEKIVSYWSNLFQAQNLPKEKLVLGVPSYAQPENPEIKQISYGAIIKQDPANAMRDSISMNGTTYHYNSGTTIQKKTNLALDNGFGGMMLWEIGLDARGAQSLTSTIYEVLKQNSNS
jgi:chitinase